MHARTLAPSRPHTLHRVHRILLVLLAVLFALLAWGSCATRYQVRMRGIHLDPSQSVAEGSAMCVNKVPEAPKLESDEIVERKIEYLVEQQGFKIVTCEEAAFVLLYKTETVPVALRTTIGPPTTSKGGLMVSTKGGPFQKVVDLFLVTAPPFVKDASEHVVWSGTAVMPEVPTTSPRFENMLLVEAFTHFPQDTGAIVTSKIALGDDAAQALSHLDPVN